MFLLIKLLIYQQKKLVGIYIFFPPSRLRLGVHKGMEWNGMYLNKGKEWKRMELNGIK